MQTDLEILNLEYRRFLEELKETLMSGKVHSDDAFDALHPDEQAKVHQRTEHRKARILQLAEGWWKERGYDVTLRGGDLSTMQVTKLLH